MLDLSFAERVEVDDAYDALLNSVAFQRYKQPAKGINAYYDALILRLYEHDGTLVDERIGPSPRQSREVPSSVPRRADKWQQMVTTARSGGAGGSNTFGPSYMYNAASPSVVLQDQFIDDRDKPQTFTLVDQFRPAVFDSPTPVLFPHANPAGGTYVALCLVYLPAPKKDWSDPHYDVNKDIKNYMLQSKYALMYDSATASSQFGYLNNANGP